MSSGPIRMFQVDAFTERLFSGNPAAVVVLDAWPEAELMQKIAAENNLAETAFFIVAGDHVDLRWFTPAVEIDLCGHATLASAHVLYEHLGWQQESIPFHTRSGILTVRRQDKRYSMDFPARPGQPCSPPAELLQAFPTMPRQVLKARDYLLLFEHEEEIAGMRPQLDKLRQGKAWSCIVTAPGREVDFVCRFFAPDLGVDEDPVTGSAQCTLVPYWARRLGRQRLSSRQLSARGGDVESELCGDRIWITGSAVTFCSAVLSLESSR